MNTTTLNTYHVFSGFCPNILPAKEKKLFDELGHIVKFKKNKFIYKEGTNPRGAYLILKGMVKINQIDSEGVEQILFFFAQNELFGYRSLLSNTNHTISAICLEDCEIKFIDYDSFNKMLEVSTVFSRILLSRVCHELTVMINQVTIYAQKGIRARLAFALLILNEKFRAPNSTEAASTIKISRTNLAAYVGSSIDVVSRNMKYYTERNLIKTDGKYIHILDFKSLYSISGVS